MKADVVRVPADLAGSFHGGDFYVNDLYQVEVTNYPNGSALLSIKPRDGSARHDWREFQWIKNELVGEEREAMEIYPAESRLVDTSNQFWLYVLPPGKILPFGWSARLVSEAVLWQTSTQRPFPEDRRPPDLLGAQEAREAIHRYLAGESREPGREPGGRA